jgi:hypothetical protein
MCSLQETLLIGKHKHCLRVKGWKKIYQANCPSKQAGIVIFISDKVDFKPKLVRRDKEGHFRQIKGTIHQEEILFNLYAPMSVDPNSLHIQNRTQKHR